MDRLKNMFKKTAVVFALASSVILSGAANAASDTSGFADVLTDIAAVGALVFSVHMAVHALKWVRRAF